MNRRPWTFRALRPYATIDNELIAAIPSSRGYQSFTVLQPGLNVQGADVGGVTGALFSVFQAHGGRRNEGQVQVNGLSAGWQGMGVSGYVPEVGSAQEVTFQITGGLGEAATGGPADESRPAYRRKRDERLRLHELGG